MRARARRVTGSAAWSGVALMAGLLAQGAVLAAQLQISSTRIELSPERPIASLEVRNGSDETIGVQADVVAWSQDATGDVYTPTRDVLANPAIFRLAPDSAQVLRFGLQPGDAGAARSYWLFVQELPRENSPPGVVQTLLRFSVPIFVPVEGNAPDLRWQLVSDGKRGADLMLGNEGTRHIQVTRLRLRDDKGQTLADQRLSAYVLPGSAQRLPVSLPALPVGQAIRIEVESDYDVGVAPVSVDVQHAGRASR